MCAKEYRVEWTCFSDKGLRSWGWEEAEKIIPGQRENLSLPEIMGRCDSGHVFEQIITPIYLSFSLWEKKNISSVH